MSNQTTETAFEIRVEEVLLTKSGWHRGTNSEWDKNLALFPAEIFRFPSDP